MCVAGGKPRNPALRFFTKKSHRKYFFQPSTKKIFDMGNEPSAARVGQTAVYTVELASFVRLTRSNPHTPPAVLMQPSRLLQRYPDKATYRTRPRLLTLEDHIALDSLTLQCILYLPQELKNSLEKIVGRYSECDKRQE